MKSAVLRVKAKPMAKPFRPPELRWIHCAEVTEKTVLACGTKMQRAELKTTCLFLMFIHLFKLTRIYLRETNVVYPQIIYSFIWPLVSCYWHWFFWFGIVLIVEAPLLTFRSPLGTLKTWTFTKKYSVVMANPHYRFLSHGCTPD